MDIKQPVTASNSNAGLKNFIIGKMWINSNDNNRPGSIRISRSLPTDVVLKASTTLFLTPNKKRDGKNDADFSVTVLLPTETADALIAAEKVIAAKFNQDQEEA